MLLGELTQLSSRLAQTRKRSVKVSLIADALHAAPHEERTLAVLYLTGELRQKKLGIGGAQLRALRDVAAADVPQLRLSEVDQALDAVVEDRGTGSTARRAARLRELFARATADEQHFVAKLVVGELRQGALESLVLEAVSQAAKVGIGPLRRARMLAPDLEHVVRAAFEEGELGLSRFDLQLFRPVQPMLAEPADDVADVLTRLSRAAFEHKLDGARIQVHKRGDDVRVFTRGLNDVTHAVPEVVELLRTVEVSELIVDGEVLALHDDGRPYPFQDTMRRFGRKLDVEALRQQLPLSPFFFDCLYLDGASLLDAPTERRIAALHAAIPGNARVPRIVTEDAQEAQSFLDQALAQGHEGVMAKALDAPYFAGSRGASWLKLKQAHTLDLVVLAAEWGSGRRTGFLSNLHLGARDEDTGSFVMLGKTFKGLTDELLRFQTQALLALETHRDAHTVYVKPDLVVEILLNDVQTSPHYPAGLALRFARVKRYRPDKQAHEADTLARVRALHTARS